MDAKMEKIIKAIKEKTAMPAYKLELVKDSAPDIFDSKIGGVPYWDLSKEYPTSSNGNKLMLLAQINFTKAALEDERLPRKGMLQFFIASDDDVYGMDFDEADSQADYRVVFHEEIDLSVTEDAVVDLDIPIATDDDMDMDCTPIMREATLTFQKAEAYIGPSVAGFEAIFKEVVEEQLGETLEDEESFEYLEEEEYNEMCGELGNTGHWLLGYPFFTQSDPREYEDNPYYDALLFQLDSEMDDGEDFVLWGDCGVGNFFMNSEDLKNGNFSKVMYNWDCY